MKYQYRVKNQKESFAMEISCAQCKRVLFLYQKRGPGGLLKIHPDRIMEAEINPFEPISSWHCPHCNFPLANRKKMNGKILYRVIRGHVNTKKRKSCSG